MLFSLLSVQCTSRKKHENYCSLTHFWKAYSIPLCRFCIFISNFAQHVSDVNPISVNPQTLYFDFVVVVAVANSSDTAKEVRHGTSCSLFFDHISWMRKMVNSVRNKWMRQFYARIKQISVMSSALNGIRFNSNNWKSRLEFSGLYLNLYIIRMEFHTQKERETDRQNIHHIQQLTVCWKNIIIIQNRVVSSAISPDKLNLILRKKKLFV